MNKFELIQTQHYPAFDLKITLKPSFRCNHMCWFCDEYDNKTKQWSREDCDLVLSKLSEIPEQKKRLFVYFYGGEPTLNKHWEYIQFELVKMFKNRYLYIQTQTNLSIDQARLDSFLSEINHRKDSKHKIDICSSYHLNKQTIDEFIEKMYVCESHDCLGLCFFSTEVHIEDQFLREFYQLVDHFPDKVKLRFTEIHDITRRGIDKYDELLEDEYLRGSDAGKSLEFRYLIKKYPEFRKFFETGFNFNVDGVVKNFSEVSAENIHKQFKYMSCDCGTKNIVIDHNKIAHHCNDDFYNKIPGVPVSELDIVDFISRKRICLNHTCHDGLEFTKQKI